MKEVNKMVEEKFNPQALGQVVSQTWPESAFANLDILAGPQVNTLLTLCPLYKPGALKSSELMTESVAIEQSRVANKWSAVNKVLGAMHGYLSNIGGELKLQTVFANKAVLLAHKPTDQDYQALAWHSQIYQQALDQFCNTAGINYVYNTYTGLAVPGLDFVNPVAEIPEAVDKPTAHQLIDHFNAFLKYHNLPTQVEDNRKNRRVIDELHAMGGETSSQEVYHLVTGYLAFDYQIPQLVGPSGLYIATERFEPLFRISKLTPGLKALPRIHLKA